MAKKTFTIEERAMYFNGQLKHVAYNETVQMAAEAAYHADGLYPKEMVECRRPSESEKVKEYRQKIWKPVTTPTWGKVITELNKIRRSSDWAIKYDDSKVPPKIIEPFRLKDYCEQFFPTWGSITNWAFSALLPQYCKDANAVIAIMPISVDIEPNEYYKPFPYLFNSSQVIDYVDEDYAVIKSSNKVVGEEPDGRKFFGNVYYFFTDTFLERWEQVRGNGEYTRKFIHFHNLRRLPVFKVRGIVHKIYDQTIVFKSRLHRMIPRLDEALREYSDMQAEVVQHIYSERWEMVEDDCPTCKGKGVVKNAGFSSREEKCNTCGGEGVKQRGQFSVMKIRRGLPGEGNLPVPPAGIIEKDATIVKIQDERIDKHEFKALSAINMEYLANTPLSQSGVAKETDRDPANTFVHSVAEDIVAVLDRVYFFINEYRYRFFVENELERSAMLPFIPVPDRFDLLSASYLEAKIQKQKESKVNPIVTNATEEDYVNKIFEGNNALKQRVLLTIRLDPLAGVSEEDKVQRLSNRGISLKQYIVSCNVEEFLERAIEETSEEKFMAMNLLDQKKLLLGYAQEMIDAESPAKKILSDIGDPADPEDEVKPAGFGQQ